ncbi:MAG: XRE family transcriptional regulator [Desulfobacteraceae bacterium]|nr:MAG: XRE family transcriptional regulator [Desulfobacteraceae bacterium]
MLEKMIADKIRQIRKSKGLTLAQFGEIVGLSKGLLSRIENNQVSPPIGTLSKISQGLEVPIAIFFENAEEDNKRYTVTKVNERRQVVRYGTKIGFTYYSIKSMKRPCAMQAFIMQTPPHKNEPKLLFDHPGEELLLVLKGEMEFVYGKEKIRLDVGDAIHFDPLEPHRAQCVGKEDGECLVVVVGERNIAK